MLIWIWFSSTCIVWATHTSSLYVYTISMVENKPHRYQGEQGQQLHPHLGRARLGWPTAARTKHPSPEVAWSAATTWPEKKRSYRNVLTLQLVKTAAQKYIVHIWSRNGDSEETTRAPFHLNKSFHCYIAGTAGIEPLAASSASERSFHYTIAPQAYELS